MCNTRWDGFTFLPVCFWQGTGQIWDPRPSKVMVGGLLIYTLTRHNNIREELVSCYTDLPWPILFLSGSDTCFMSDIGY